MFASLVSLGLIVDRGDQASPRAGIIVLERSFELTTRNCLCFGEVDEINM